METGIKRSIKKAIKEQITKFPIMALTGPRQSGKTTLLKTLFDDYTYVSLENPDNRDFAENDPKGFLKLYHSKVIFDEVQRVPSLFSYLQTIVDESKQMGQFILSGSQNFHLISNITQSLAGRVVIFKLLPFDFNELKTKNLLEKNYEDACIKGFYPAIYDRDISPSVFYANYLQTYVERDVTELVNIKNTKQFRTFVVICASRAGQLLNINTIANECDISQPTAKSWLTILESSYIIFMLQPYYQNFNKRLVKTPKLYFYDTGLLCHLLKIKNDNDFRKNRLLGNIFENLVIAEIQKQNQHLYQHNEYYFWQDSHKNEVDLLRPTGNGYDILEVKATRTIMSSLFEQLDKFEANADQETLKNLIYGGNENQKRTTYNIVSWYNLDNKLFGG